MEYRLLKQEEWDRLKDVVPDEYLPRPEYSMAAISEDKEGNITGFLIMQLALHLQPIGLSSPNISFKRLYETLMENLPAKGAKFYAYSDKEVVGRMAEHVGMKELPLKVYEGEVV